jgi:hypothetical protein
VNVFRRGNAFEAFRDLRKASKSKFNQPEIDKRFDRVFNAMAWYQLEKEASPGFADYCEEHLEDIGNICMIAKFSKVTCTRMVYAMFMLDDFKKMAPEVDE